MRQDTPGEQAPASPVVRLTTRAPADLVTQGMTGWTATEGSAGEPSASPSLEEGSTWGKYEICRLVGTGGMADVYAAYDPVLRRLVALKLIHMCDPLSVSRLLQEARSQAKIEHENVCEVFEAGQHDGRFYIAMQYIEGGTFRAMAPEMTLEQKLRVVKEAADGLHAAHRTGLIHRDLKPSNIMVQRLEDGGWKAFVTDFGLAKGADDPRLTVSGMVMGTAAYMAPEQARGEGRALDRRTDIYGLGATLYEALSGAPPFLGNSSVDTLLDVVQKDAIPLRRSDPTLPADVETIVMKCLQKEPHRRYESAHALAEDIQRYLDGEPIAARPAGFLQRAARKVRKHKLTAALLVAAGFLAVLFAILAAHASWTSSERARIAQQYGQEIERIDGIMRVAALRPLHDTSPERAEVRMRIERIRSAMSVAGSAGIGPGYYAMGRGHLALAEYEEAHDALERAWSGGFRTPEAAYALGLTLGGLYQESLASAERVGAPEARQLLQEQARREYRDPAIEKLREARDVWMQSPRYAEALISFYEKDWDRAAALAHQAVVRNPALHEARILEGDILQARASQVLVSGDRDGALETMLAADRRYKEASEIARSDPAVYQSWSRLWGSIMTLDADTGRDPEEAFTRAMDLSASALAANPASAIPYVTSANIRARRADYLTNRGQDVSAEYHTAIALAEKARQMRPQWSEPHKIIGYAHLGIAEHGFFRGLTSDADFLEAIRSYQSALALEPRDAESLNNTGYAYVMLSDGKAREGGDPSAHLIQAEEYFVKARDLVPGNATSFSNIGMVATNLGDYFSRTGKDPRSHYQRALASYESALKLNPNHTYSLLNLGATYRGIAEYDLVHGRDPVPDAEKAVQSHRAAMKSNPDLHIPYIGVAEARHLQARSAILAGRDPEPLLRDARDTLDRALQLNPTFSQIRSRLGETFLLRARYLTKVGKPPLSAIADARSHLARAVELDPSDATPLLLIGQTEIVLGRWLIRIGQSPRGALDEARGALERAARTDGTNPGIYLARSEMEVCEVEWLNRRRQSPEPHEQLGLEAAGEALRINPDLAEAHAVEGALHLWRARRLRDRAERERAARMAAFSLDAALRINPLLASEYKTLLDEVSVLTRRPASSRSRSEAR